jgi:thioredoxin reductase (NADPH)
MTANHDGPIYDSMVIGGGPAGLSAALQLARSNRQVVVVDSGAGRSTYRQVNHNYPGFPGGIAAREFRELARKQVAMYPVAFVDEAVHTLTKARGQFNAVLDSTRVVCSQTLVMATGVRDHFPQVPDWESYVGRSLFWCIVCDGYSSRGKNLIAVGDDDEAAVTALQFLQFTDRVTLLTNSLECGIGAAAKRSLKRHGVSLIVAEIATFLGDDGVLGVVVLGDGTRLPADFVFSLQGGAPNSALAANLGVRLDKEGYVIVDEEQQTSVPGLFAAGDVSNRHAHQLATAVHEGLTAATAAQFFLYAPWQRSAGS